MAEPLARPWSDAPQVTEPEVGRASAGARGRTAALTVAAAAIGTALITFLVQAPVLGHYFYGDDFVPLAEVDRQTAWDYTRNLFLLQDVTPNWRFLAGLYYLVMHRAFELNAWAFLAGNVLVHVATGLLVFWLVWRATEQVLPATFASLFFGVTAASVPTVGQVTAFNNVLAGCFIMLAIVALYEGTERRLLGIWGPVGVIAFAGAIASNEAAAVFAPLLVGVVAWRAAVTRSVQDSRDMVGPAMTSAAILAVGAAALISFAACDCTAASDETINDTGIGHLFGNFWAYLGRLSYPIGNDSPGDASTAHIWAGIVAIGLSVIGLIRGPGLARVAVAFLALGLIPHLPIDFALAPRYVYVLTIPFAILLALLLADAIGSVRRVSPAVAITVVVLAFAMLGLTAWQTWEQNQTADAASEEWQELADGLQRRYEELPGGSIIIVRGGPITDAVFQFIVLPALGEVLWDDVRILTFPREQQEVCLFEDFEVYVVDYDGGRFTPQPVIQRDSTFVAAPDSESPLTARVCPLPPDLPVW
jgi:hypothetical protein